MCDGPYLKFYSPIICQLCVMQNTSVIKFIFFLKQRHRYTSRLPSFSSHPLSPTLSLSLSLPSFFLPFNAIGTHPTGKHRKTARFCFDDSAIASSLSSYVVMHAIPPNIILLVCPSFHYRHHLCFPCTSTLFSIQLGERHLYSFKTLGFHSNPILQSTQRLGCQTNTTIQLTKAR